MSGEPTPAFVPSAPPTGEVGSTAFPRPFASNGLGGVLGSLLAGRALDLGGANLMLACCMVCCILAAGLALASLRMSRGTVPVR